MASSDFDDDILASSSVLVSFIVNQKFNVNLRKVVKGGKLVQEPCLFMRCVAFATRAIAHAEFVAQ